MTLSDRIRAALRAGAGPMTAREIREALDDESATAENVGSTLSYMSKTGEVLREHGSAGSFAYQLDDGYVPKRTAPSQEPAAHKSGAQRIAAARATKPAKTESADTTDATPPPIAAANRPKRKYTRRAKPAPKVAARKKRKYTRRTDIAVTRAGQHLAAHVALTSSNVTVPVAREDLRIMALAVTAMHSEPMPPALKAAVMKSLELSL